MGKVHNDVCRKVIFVLVVRSSNGPVHYVDYFSSRSLVQPDLGEKVDPADCHFGMNAQIGLQYKVLRVEVSLVDCTFPLY